MQSATQAFIGLLACILFATPGWAAPPMPAHIAIVAGHQATYGQAADATRAVLTAAGHRCSSFALPEDGAKDSIVELAQQLQAANADVIACAGSDATLFALQAVADTPVVALMIPNVLDAPFMVTDYPMRARVAAVAADVNPADLVDWMRELTPGNTHLGLLYSERTNRTVDALRQAGARAGITVTAIEASKDAFPQAVEALTLANCDSVLMIPDAAVYNAPNVKRLLLWGLRQERAVWAFSGSIVKAGALAGQFPDEDSVGQGAKALIDQILAGNRAGELPVAYVARPQRAVNERTADMIHLRLREQAIDRATMRMGAE